MIMALSHGDDLVKITVAVGKFEDCIRASAGALNTGNILPLFAVFAHCVTLGIMGLLTLQSYYNSLLVPLP